jgi:hypothetical protein
MSYREKTAWLYLLAMLVCFGSYFLYLGFNPSFYDLPFLQKFIPLSIAGVLNMVVVLAGHLWLLLKTEKADRLVGDERDLKIEASSMVIAYQLLIYGMLFVGGMLPFYTSGWKVANCTILVVVIAEAVRGISVVTKYRKQMP